MVFEITVQNNEEFEQLLDDRDIRLSKALVNTILNNLKGRKKHIPFINIVVLDESSNYDLTVERSEFLDTLNLQLPIFEQYELFEKCREIVTGIKYLEEQLKKPKK